MAVAHSKVTAQGQISVPAEVRKKLGIVPGSILEWQEEDGKFTVRRTGRYSFDDVRQALFGDRVPEPKTLDQLKEGIVKYIKERHARD